MKRKKNYQISRLIIDTWFPPGSMFNSDKSNLSSKYHRMNTFQMKSPYWRKSFYQEKLLSNELFFKISDKNASLIRTRIGERNGGNDENAGNQGGNAEDQSGNTGNEGGNAENRVGNVGNQSGNAESQGGNARNQGDSSWESSWLSLRLKSQSARGAFHHPLFMGCCPTIIYTFFFFFTPIVFTENK